MLRDERPLSGHCLAEGHDPEFIRSAVCHAFGDYRLSQVGRDCSLRSYFRGLRLSSGGVYYVENGADAQIEPQEVDGFYLVQVLLAGSARVSLSSETFVATPDRAFIVQPGHRLSLWVGKTTRHLLLRLDQVSVQQLLHKKLGRLPMSPIVFEPQIDLTTPANRAFRNLLTLFVDTLDDVPGRSFLAMAEFEALLVSQLVLGQPNNYYDQLHNAPSLARPRPVARAAELIEARVHEPLSVDDIACAVGMSVRALQDGFRRVYDTTPMAFLREVRLRRVRTELLQADPDSTSVTVVALQWGFHHLGRFSVLYHRRFGETASETLRYKGSRSPRSRGTDRTNEVTADRF